MENDYEEIDLRELIQIILRKWWLIIIITVISGIGAYLVTSFYIEPVYESSTSLFIGKEQNEIAGISIADLQVGNKLIVDYREIAQTRMIAQAIIDELNLNMNINTFRQNISINNVKDSRLFTIKFQHSNPQLAADIANAVAKELSIKVSDIIDVENIQVIDKALVPVNPIKPNKMLNTAIACVLGVMLSLFIIMLIEFIDNTIKTEDDIERHLGLAVIGVIPKFKGEDK